MISEYLTEDVKRFSRDLLLYIGLILLLRAPEGQEFKRLNAQNRFLVNVKGPK